MAKEKKKVSPKRMIIGTSIWVIAIAFIIINVSNSSDDNDKEADDSVSSGETASGEQAVTVEETDEVAEASEQEEPEEEEEGSNELSDLVDTADLEDGKLTINKELTSFFSENTILKHDVYDYFELMGQFFSESEDIDSVFVILSTAMIDEKGNEEVESAVEFEYTREDFEELNYENFLDLSYSQTWRILNESSYYMIHPGIYKNVDEDYTDNLTNGVTKVPLVEE